jgi:hypothetical protein
MQGLLADINIKGHMRVLLRLLESRAWRDLWEGLNVHVRTFPELGLAPNASDALIWHTCQQHQLVLITANRNKHGADSLEATIPADNTPSSLPVLTFASPRRSSRTRRTRIASWNGCWNIFGRLTPFAAPAGSTFPEAGLALLTRVNLPV